jgi:hypothetical protein
MLETMKKLFGVMHIGEEEIPNVKCMRVGEEEVLLSQSVTAAVLSKEEEVQVPQVPTVTVPSKEEEVPVPQGPTITVESEEGEAMDLIDEGPVPPLVCYSPFFFFSKMQKILLALFFLKNAVDL